MSEKLLLNLIEKLDLETLTLGQVIDLHKKGIDTVFSNGEILEFQVNGKVIMKVR